MLKEEFAGREGVRESKSAGDAIQWLRGGGAGGVAWERPRWFDHGTRWIKDGQPYCLVGQPYGLLPDPVRELASLSGHGMNVIVDVEPSGITRAKCSRQGLRAGVLAITATLTSIAVPRSRLSAGPPFRTLPK